MLVLANEGMKLCLRVKKPKYGEQYFELFLILFTLTRAIPKDSKQTRTRKIIEKFINGVIPDSAKMFSLLFH